MSSYTNYSVYLNHKQAKVIKNSHEKKKQATITISKNCTGGQSVEIPLTITQINKIQKAKNKVKLTLSTKQLNHMNKTGGFLPLLGLLPAIIGAAGGLAGGIASAVNSSKQTAEQKRHNQALENIAKGSGIISDKIEPIPVIGTKLASALRKIGLGNCCVKDIKGAIWGNGIYLERQGNGLFLARQGE